MTTKNAVEIFCYSNVKKPDAVTKQFRALPYHWCDTFSLTDAWFCDGVRQDQIDILVDLAGHTADSRIDCFAYRFAPISGSICIGASRSMASLRAGPTFRTISRFIMDIFPPMAKSTSLWIHFHGTGIPPPVKHYGWQCNARQTMA